MSIRINVPSNLREYTQQHSIAEVNACQVGQALQLLIAEYPQLAGKLLSDTGELHSFINVFVGGRSVRDLQGLNTPLESDANLLIVPALAGG